MGDYIKYMDTSLSAKERAKALLSELSLDEKMAQINCLFPFRDREEYKAYYERESKYGIRQVSTLQLR